MIASTPVDILRFLVARVDEGVPGALVTLTGIDGSSPRAVGAQMAVAADGRYAGSLSGGCVEAAVVAEALDALADDRSRLVRFGAGSPYLDIRLPCGSGIDLLFNPRPDRAVLASAIARHERRQPAALRLSEQGVEPAADHSVGAPTGWTGGKFGLHYPPPLKLVAIGQGEEIVALARLARSFGVAFDAMSPDGRAIAALADLGVDATQLKTPAHTPPVASDPWTAIVFLFHDREWEEHLLLHALRAPSFFVGAIGSRKTQAMRRTALADAGATPALLERLRTTVGLIPATRDPATLALSTLAQIVEDYQLVATGPWHADRVRLQNAHLGNPQLRI